MEAFENVWDALDDTPEDAARMTVLSRLLMAVQEKVKGWKLTRVKAARRLGIGQARFSDLLRGNISEFDIDEIVILAVRAGLKVSVEIRDAAYTARGEHAPLGG